jgi:hypothetical protein
MKAKLRRPLHVYSTPRASTRTAVRWLKDQWTFPLLLVVTLGSIDLCYRYLLVPRLLLPVDLMRNVAEASRSTQINGLLRIAYGIPRFLLESFGLLCMILMAGGHGGRPKRAKPALVIRTAARQYLSFAITNGVVGVLLGVVASVGVVVASMVYVWLPWVPHSDSFFSFQILLALLSGLFAFVVQAFFAWAPYIKVLHAEGMRNSIALSVTLLWKNRPAIAGPWAICFGVPWALQIMDAAIAPTQVSIGVSVAESGFIYVWNYIVAAYIAAHLSASSKVPNVET